MLGPGRLGQALAARLEERGHDLALGRDPGLARGRDLVLLCVPDRAVADVAAALPADDAQWRAHCAGALGLDVLGAGHRRALCVHPLMTVVPGGDPAQLDGAHAAVTARDGEGRTFGLELAHELRLQPFLLAEPAKPLYHCAGAIASNLVSTLLAAAVRVAGRAGVPEPADALAPLFRRAAENALADPVRFGLTGPVARGDAATVRLHLQALSAAAPELLPLYRTLARATVELLAPERQDELAEVLPPC